MYNDFLMLEELRGLIDSWTNLQGKFENMSVSSAYLERKKSFLLGVISEGISFLKDALDARLSWDLKMTEKLQAPRKLYRDMDSAIADHYQLMVSGDVDELAKGSSQNKLREQEMAMAHLDWEILEYIGYLVRSRSLTLREINQRKIRINTLVHELEEMIALK